MSHVICLNMQGVELKMHGSRGETATWDRNKWIEIYVMDTRNRSDKVININETELKKVPIFFRVDLIAERKNI